MVEASSAAGGASGTRFGRAGFLTFARVLIFATAERFFRLLERVGMIAREAPPRKADAIPTARERKGVNARLRSRIGDR
ncbi:MAG: hypothetical protein ACREQQ_05090, partial [Candidatus Binatia bacterium]